MLVEDFDIEWTTFTLGREITVEGHHKPSGIIVKKKSNSAYLAKKDCREEINKQLKNVALDVNYPEKEYRSEVREYLSSIRTELTKPRQLSICRFDLSMFTKEQLSIYFDDHFADENSRYIFFGEIPNMPGHCVVMNVETKQWLSGYHTQNFIEITEDEDDD